MLENGRAADLAEDLRLGFYGGLPLISGERSGPISVDEDDHDRSKIVVVYRPDRKRNPADDMPRIVSVFGEAGVQATEAVVERIEEAFDALQSLSAQGHAAAETVRRSVRKGPRGPGSR
jgi:cell division septation protein DedD